MNVCRGDNRDAGFLVDLFDLLVEVSRSSVVVEQLDLKIVAVAVDLSEHVDETGGTLKPLMHGVYQTVICLVLSSS